MSAYLYDKSKLPKGWSFPIKRGELDSALDGLDAEAVFAVRFVGPLKCKTLISASFSGESKGGYSSGKISIDVCAVRSENRGTAHEVTVSEILPELVDWITAASAAGNVWRAVDHRISFELNDSDLL